MRLLILLLFMATSVFSQNLPPIETGVSQTLAQWRAKHYSDVRYKLNLTIEKMSPVLKGTIEVSVKSGSDQIILDWRKNRSKEDAYSIKNVTLNGKPTEFEEINEHLIFKNAVNGENVIKIEFTSPISTSGSAITRYIDKEDGSEYIYSLFVPSDASTAFPVFDQPDLKARFSLEVFTPENWSVISNTKGESFINSYATREGRKTDYSTKFPETQPISTYVFAFAAGNFEEVKVTEISHPTLTPDGKNQKLGERFTTNIYVRKSQAEKFQQHSLEVFRLNRECVKYLEEYFDYKFPFPKYDLVLIPEFPFGGMEHAGATFLRESSIIFPSEPTKNDIISRANLIFHEAAHQWFGDTVTMKWFDDLWLKEGFAEFMAYKALEKIMPEMNAWKAFYERNKQLAYLTDSTKGTTPIYQEIPNLSSAKSAYGNIVYRKAPSFLKQAEFYLGKDQFKEAVRKFIKKYEFGNATWQDLVVEFQKVSKFNKTEMNKWATEWVKQKGLPIIRIFLIPNDVDIFVNSQALTRLDNTFKDDSKWRNRINTLWRFSNGSRVEKIEVVYREGTLELTQPGLVRDPTKPLGAIETNGSRAPNYIFPNYQDYGYGIFLLDERSRNYIFGNVQNETDDFLRSMMYGSLWDSVREAELNPKDFVELAIKNVGTEKDEMIVSVILSRVNTAFAYYLDDKTRNELSPKLEEVLINKMQTVETLGQKITFYRAFLNIANSENARNLLKDFLKPNGKSPFTLKTKDKFDIIAKLFILGDKDAPNLLNELTKTETSDDAKRYTYSALAGMPTAENKAKYWQDFVANKEISESWIESAFGNFNSVKHSDLTIQYLEKALSELPNLKRNRKIFFVNGWLSAFIGGQKSEQALAIVNKFLADNPNLDKDLRLKILENVDLIERAVKIRQKFAN